MNLKSKTGLLTTFVSEPEPWFVGRVWSVREKVVTKYQQHFYGRSVRWHRRTICQREGVSPLRIPAKGHWGQNDRLAQVQGEPLGSWSFLLLPRRYKAKVGWDNPFSIFGWVFFSCMAPEWVLGWWKYVDPNGEIWSIYLRWKTSRDLYTSQHRSKTADTCQNVYKAEREVVPFFGWLLLGVSKLKTRQ